MPGKALIAVKSSRNRNLYSTDHGLVYDAVGSIGIEQDESEGLQLTVPQSVVTRPEWIEVHNFTNKPIILKRDTVVASFQRIHEDDWLVKKAGAKCTCDLSHSQAEPLYHILPQEELERMTNAEIDEQLAQGVTKDTSNRQVRVRHQARKGHAPANQALPHGRRPRL